MTNADIMSILRLFTIAEEHNLLDDELKDLHTKLKLVNEQVKATEEYNEKMKKLNDDLMNLGNDKNLEENK